MTYAKILVVEDEGIVAKDIESTLRDLGYVVVGIASSGEAAIKEAEKKQPSLILMDIKIKGSMDGIETAKQIQSRFDIPVIYLTAFADEETLSRAKITQPFGYIIKPFEEKDLHSTIEMALYKHKIDVMLKESEERHRDLYNKAPDGYLSANINGEILEANETFLKMSGYSYDDVKDSNITGFVDEKELESFRENYAKIIAEGTLSNFELNMRKKDGTSFTALLNASVERDENGKPIKSMLIIRDISNMKKLEKDKKELTDKVIKLTKKIPLTDNEKKVFYGIVKYPLLNDVELSAKLKIKRSTITSIKNKLIKDKLYSAFRIPNFSLLGCEILSIMHNKLNPSAQHRIKKFSVCKEAANAPEQVQLSMTDRELMGICISRNLTDFKRHMDSLLIKYKQYDLVEYANVSYFPFETSKIEKLFDYSSFLKSLFELNIENDASKQPAAPKKRKLTDKEKVILYALVRFPELNDSEIAEKAKLPRPSVSQTRRKLVKDGFLSIVNVPSPIQLRCELMALDYILYDSRLSAASISKVDEYIKNKPYSIFVVNGGFELYAINVYNDYTEYEVERNNETKFYSDNSIAIEKHDTAIFPTPQLQFQKLDFAPLVKKILEIKAEF